MTLRAVESSLVSSIREGQQALSLLEGLLGSLRASSAGSVLSQASQPMPVLLTEEMLGAASDFVRSNPHWTYDELYAVFLKSAPSPVPAPAPSKGSDWPKDWQEHGFNRCIPAAVKALRYLADNERPRGGSTAFNAEHLFQLADELEKSRVELLAPAQS